MKVEKIIKTEDEWKKLLTPLKYHILREKGTERPNSGKECLENNEKGIYQCGGCDLDLFSSDKMFHSGSGWPSFFDIINEDHIIKNADNSLGMSRIEVTCARCDSHLGHLFDDGPEPTGKRFCINCLSLKFNPAS